VTCGKDNNLFKFTFKVPESDDDEDITGIQELHTSETVKAPVYNLQGVRVNSHYRGLKIKNGKKYLR